MTRPRLLAPLALGSLLVLSSPPLRAVTADGFRWNATHVGDVGYLPLEDLRSFYKFTSDSTDRKTGVRTVSDGTSTLSFGPGARELSVNGVLCHLSHPSRTDANGGLLVSRVDVVKLLDPVLRPTYIAKRLEIKRIVLDPAHGGHDAGNVSGQVREADCALALARQLAAELRARGYETVLTREENQYLSDQQRIDRANRAADAIFISLHLNSGRSDIHGIETYTCAPSGPGDEKNALPGNAYDAANIALAFALQSSMLRATGAKDGGCRRARYSMLNSLRCPAALVELGYATHEEEGPALATDAYRRTLCAALADGIDTFVSALKPGATAPVSAAAPVTAPPTPVRVESTDRASKSSSSGKSASAKTTGKRSSSAKSSGKSASRTTSKTASKPATKIGSKSSAKSAGTGSRQRKTKK